VDDGSFSYTTSVGVTFGSRERGGSEMGGNVPVGSKEELDKEWIELLNELRVVLPGVQVLFAFLLAAPFSQRFSSVTEVQENAYFLSLLFTTISAGLMTAPTTFHRLRWRHGDKEKMLKIMNPVTIAGGVFLALAMTAAFFVIADVIFGGVLAVVWTTSISLTLFGLWYGLALIRKVDEGD
jgi:hypothetical protein